MHQWFILLRNLNIFYQRIDKIIKKEYNRELVLKTI